MYCLAPETYSALFFNHSFSLDTTHRYNHTKRQDWKTWKSMMKAFYLQTYCFRPAELFFVWLRHKQNSFNKSIRCIPMSNQKRMFFFQLVQRHESCYVLLKVANLKHSKRRSFYFGCSSFSIRPFSIIITVHQWWI